MAETTDIHFKTTIKDYNNFKIFVDFLVRKEDYAKIKLKFYLGCTASIDL